MKKLIPLLAAVLFAAVILSLTVTAAGAGKVISSVADNGEVVEDGINTYVATVWIIAVGSVLFCAIITAVIVLAKKNKNAK